MVTSSVSPERAETIVPKPAARAASKAALAPVTVPAWFGLTRSALQAPSRAACSTRRALVTRQSSPTTCTRSPTAAVKRRMPRTSSSASGSSMETIG